MNILQTFVFRSVGKPAIKSAVHEAIMEILEQLNKSTCSQWPVYENQALSVQKLSLGSSLAQVKVLGSMLHTVCEAARDPELVVTWTSSSLPLSCPIPHSEMSVLNCVVVLLSVMPVHDWSLLSEWVSQEINSHKSHLEEKISSSVKFVLSRKPCLASQALVTKYGPQRAYDPRFDLQKQETVTDLQDTFDFESLCNKTSLWLWHSVYHCFKQNAMTQRFKTAGKLDTMTLLEVSNAVNKGLVSSSSSPHPSVPLLTPLFSQINQIILSLTDDTCTSISNQQLCHLLSALRWCDHLFQFCCQIVSKSNFHLILPQLTLHWHWVYEEFMLNIPDSWNSFISKQFKKMVKTMNSEFEQEYGPIHKAAARFRSCRSPAPFPSDVISAAQFRFLDLMFSLAPAPDNENVNIFLASSTGREVNELLINIAQEVAACNVQMVNDIHEQITHVENTVKEKCLGHNVPPKLGDKDVLALQIQTWPLRDYLAMHLLSLERVGGELSPLLRNVVTGSPGVFTELTAFLSGPAFRPSSVLGTHSYLALIQSTASQQTPAFLTYPQVSTEKEEPKNNVLLHPAACQLSYILLAGRSTSNYDIESVMNEVPTGLHVEKVAQLKAVKSTLWDNWSILADPSLSYEASFTKYVISFITSSLKVFANIFGIASEYTELDGLQLASCLASSINESHISVLPDNIQKHFFKMAEVIKRLQNCSEDLKDKANIAAQAAVLIGIIQTYILSHLEPVDPAQCHALRLQYYQEEMEDLESHLLLAAWFEHLRGSLVSPRGQEAHPHLLLFEARCQQVQSEIAQLSQQTAHRSSAVEYHQLKQDFANFSSTVFMPKKVQEVSESLLRQENDMPSESLSAITEVLLASCDNFVKRIVQQYPLYRDITYPFLQAVTVTCEALRLLHCHSHIRCYSLICGINLTESLARYSSFPAHRNPSQPLHFVKDQLEFGKCIPLLLSEDQFSGLRNTASSVVLRASLLDLLNVTLAQHRLDKATVELTSEIFSKAVFQWRQQEEAKALRAEEEESLYRYKTQSLAVSETEEETQEREYQETFPSFDHEFDDLKGLNLEDSVKNTKGNNRPKDDTLIYITDDRLYEISEVHSLIFTSLAHTSWLAPCKSVSVHSQMVTAALLRFHVLQVLIGSAGTIAGCELDQAMFGAQILNNFYSSSYLTQTSHLALVGHPYDIYKDSNPQEVLKVRPLLTSVRDRVDELLKQWPGHPSLVLVNTVISRVLDFPLTSPLMKHVIGLETVLEKAQEWERNAHSGVSMREQLEAVTHQVLEWRQMELNAWRTCLDSVTHKVAIQSRKWWPYLFNTFESALTEAVSLPEVLKTLKQFLETSILGDFQMRLHLLFSFHCNLAALEKNKTAHSLAAITWNLYHYFSQFTPLVISAVAKARQPVEKEVKGYVKIARWNDINYFAVRESVDKSRRTLHRHMRNWEKKLRQPFAPLMCDSNSELTESQSGVWDQKPEDCPSLTTVVMPPPPKVTVECSEEATKNPIISRLPFLTRRCHKLTRKLLSSLPYSLYVGEVEDITVQIISSYQELQAAASQAEAASTDKTRVKQLRGVMQRRREGLTRLCKTLTSMGIFYTLGNSIWHPDDIDSCLRLTPVDLVVAHSDAATLHPAREAWPGCVKYINRSVGRLTLLLSSLQQPHKDLGSELIKRLRGISCHLFLLARDQRKSLSHISEYTHRLHHLLKDIREVSSCPYSKDKMLTKLQHLHALTASLSLCLEESGHVLGTYSNTQPLLMLEENCVKLEVNEARNLLQKSADKIHYMVPKLASLLRYLQADHRLVTPTHLKQYSDAIDTLTQEAQNLNEVIKMLSVRSGEPHPAISQLNIWLKEWKAAHSDLSEVTDLHLPDTSENVDFAPLERCLTQILLSVESLYKRHCSSKTMQDDGEEIVKDLISLGLVKQIEFDTKDLQLKESVHYLQQLVKVAELQPGILLKLKAALPLLEQYHSICESLLNMLTVSNRSIAKLTSVILAVFQNLATSGFCRPKELQDEENGEEGTNFEDAEGTGLGEGEGKKDVSDRIESEDQLESALKEGESEQAGDKDLQEEDKGIEMNEDFEGKMQDIEKKGEENESDDDDDDKDQEDLDKQMGETDKGADKLDEKLWGEDADSEEEDAKDQNDDEDGPGEGDATESKTVAKDDNKSKKENDKKQKEKEKLEEIEDTRKENEMNEDGEEYDDNFTDPYGGEANMEDDDDEKMELPDDMNLDDGEQNEQEEDMEQPPMEIEEKGVFPEEEKEPKEDGKEDENEEQSTTEKQEVNDEAQSGKNDEEEDGDGEQDEEGSSEAAKKDERKQGTEELNDVDNDEEMDDSADKADASADKDSKTPAEAAEMDTTEGSKDQTKVMDSCSW